MGMEAYGLRSRGMRQCPEGWGRRWNNRPVSVSAIAERKVLITRNFSWPDSLAPSFYPSSRNGYAAFGRAARVGSILGRVLICSATALSTSASTHSDCAPRFSGRGNSPRSMARYRLDVL